MKYLKRFNEDIEATIKPNGTISANIDVKTDTSNTIYDKRWEEQLPPFITINYHGELYKFKKDNVMLHSDMIQITYSSTPMDSQESGEIWQWTHKDIRVSPNITFGRNDERPKSNS